MFTKEELINKLSVDVTDYKSTDTEITFNIGDKQFELQRTGLLTLLRNDVYDKKECHFKITCIDELILAINTINDWDDDWND